jgi:hypothetical protein
LDAASDAAERVFEAEGSSRRQHASTPSRRASELYHETFVTELPNSGERVTVPDTVEVPVSNTDTSAVPPIRPDEDFEDEDDNLPMDTPNEAAVTHDNIL